MEFRLLGPVGVWAEGSQVRVGGRRERTMLALLALEAGRVVAVDRVVEVVWGAAPPPTVHRQVSNGMSVLRQALGELVLRRGPGYLLCVPPDQVDVGVFDLRVGQARAAAARGEVAEAARGLRDALGLWRGPALGGVSGLASAAARLEESRLAVLEERIELDLLLGRHADLAGELLALVVEHPFRERLRAHLMLALYRCGRQVEALAAYRDARRMLIDGLGLEPGAELRRLERAILAEDPGLDPVPAAPGTRPPVAPPSSRPAAGAAPCLLPSDIADFVGRDRQIDLLCGVLVAATGDAVVVSAVAGRAGVGKTALAVHVAHRLRGAFPDGQLYVNLHGTRQHPAEPADVLARFLRALGMDGPAIPDGVEERAELYRDRLAGRRMLVLLDDAKDEAQVGPLLPGSPSAAVLVTSRTRLVGLAGARPVELNALASAEAVALLARIAGPDRLAAEPDVAARLAELCGRLPLAVRIAGARLANRPHWTVSGFAARLADERHRLDELAHGGLAVRASLALSYNGLVDPARRLFRLLGLLSTPDFAAWVGAALLDTTAAEAEELADRLVDAQLLEVVGRDQCGVLRYRFHDLVRLYAHERAVAEEPAADRTAALARAFGAWLALAEEAHRGIYGGDYLLIHGHADRWRLDAELAGRLVAEPLVWLEAERLAIVAVVAQAARAGMDELTWDLARSSVALFATRFYLDDWRQTLDHALAATRQAGNRRGAATTLYSFVGWHDSRGQHTEALTCADAALAMFEELGERHGYALALSYAAHLDRRFGRFKQSLARAEQARVALREVGDRAGEAEALQGIAQTNRALGRLDEAEAALGRALAVLPVDGSRRERAQLLCEAGELQLRRGSFGRAEHSFGQVLEIVRELHDRVGEAYAWHGLGIGQRGLGRYDQAETSLAEALALARETGAEFAEARALLSLGELHRIQGRPDDAVTRLHRAHDLLSGLNMPLYLARALDALGEVHRTTGNATAAATAWRRAHALYTEIGAPEAKQVAASLASIDVG